MVNTEMFRGAFDFSKKPAAQPQPQAQPQYIPNPNYVAPAAIPKYHEVPPTKDVPVPHYAPEDPEIAKMRAWLLKALVILIGGAAILLIVWRIILKFI